MSSTAAPAEVRAARDRLALAPHPDSYTGLAIANRLAALSIADPDFANDVADVLGQAVDTLAARHTVCHTVGCDRCLYLADAAATVTAWRAGR